jgi:predicted nucleotidyltransferase
MEVGVIRTKSIKVTGRRVKQPRVEKVNGYTSIAPFFFMIIVVIIIDMSINKNIKISDVSIRKFCKRWHIKEFSLFGSVLRDDFRPDSDIDILVTFKKGHRLNLASYLKMLDELSHLFRHTIDFVDRKNLINPFRKHEILKTRQIVYEEAA